MHPLAAPRSAASALLLTRLGAEREVEAATVLAGTGLTLADLRDPGTVVTGLQELAVIRNLTGACADPALPLAAGRRYHLTTYGIWGFALASSLTLRDAIDVGSRFIDLSFTFCALEVTSDSAEVRLRLDDASVPLDVRPFVVARDLVGLWTLAGEIAPGLSLRRVRVRLPEPVDVDAWQEVFGLRPDFGADRNEIALDAAELDRPLPQADELTAAATEQQCRELVQRRRARSGVAGAVRDELLRTPAGMPAADQVSARLGLSERTLRRRLAAAGTSYRHLVDEVRMALAEELLVTESLSVEQVARRLGYAETASFTRAFARWTGASPRAWRQRRAGQRPTPRSPAG